MQVAEVVAFAPLATGQIQILRTGSGFWRWDHGAPFSIDEAQLATILRNTKLRGRPLRVDFMHWANGDRAQGLGELVKAGEVSPSDIFMEAWPDPATGAQAHGLFCPVVWTPLGAQMAPELDEISPVIEWEYVLPFDVLDEAGAVVPAGTCLGPTITGISLVDEGFFWMDKVRVYSARGPASFLYQERTIMTLTPEQLAAFITWATEQGWEEATINAMIAAATADAAPAAPEAAPAAPEMAADPNAAAEVMAARAALTQACTTKNPAQIQAAQKAYSAALAKTKKGAAAPAKAHPLAALLAAATTARANVTRTAAPAVTRASAAPAAPAVSYAHIEEQLAAQKEITDNLMMKELEREGLLVGIDDPMELYRQAPSYFMKKVQGNVSLAGSGAPAPGARPLLREVTSAADDEGEVTHRQVTAYRNEQVKAGRKLSYQQALVEWEGKNPQAKKKALL